MTTDDIAAAKAAGYSVRSAKDKRGVMLYWPVLPSGIASTIPLPSEDDCWRVICRYMTARGKMVGKKDGQ